IATLRPRGATAGTGGALVVSLATARRLLAMAPGRVHCLRLRLRDGVEAEAIRQKINERLPDNMTVQAPGDRSELADSTLHAAELGLNALGGLALLTAGFVVLNTSLLNLHERRHQFALLKTLGATSSQVLRL